MIFNALGNQSHEITADLKTKADTSDVEISNQELEAYEREYLDSTSNKIGPSDEDQSE